MGIYAGRARDKATCAGQAGNDPRTAMIYLHEAATALRRACREGENIRDIEEASAAMEASTRHVARGL